METTSQGEEMEVVAAGMACNITPAAARSCLPHPGIRFIPVEDGPATEMAIARSEQVENPLARAFVDAAWTVRQREVDLVRRIETATL